MMIPIIPVIPVVARPTVVSPAREAESQKNVEQGDSWHAKRMRQQRRNILNKIPELQCELESLFPQLEIKGIFHKREIGVNIGEFEDYLEFCFTVCGCKDEFGWEKVFSYEECYATSYSTVVYALFKKKVIHFFTNFFEKKEMI